MAAKISNLTGRVLLPGTAHGEVLKCNTSLSFWGGVDPTDGTVIDQHHPLRGESLSGKILAIPGSRGSSSGSGVLLELILNHCAPAALIFSSSEEILTLGVIIAARIFDHSIPVLQVSAESFDEISSGTEMWLSDSSLTLSPPQTETSTDNQTQEVSFSSLQLSAEDCAKLHGDQGPAAQVAMQIVCHMAVIQGARELTRVTQAHIDACVYNGQSSLRFAQHLLAMGASVAVPTTLNALSVDQKRWRQQHVDASFAEPASALGDTFVAMGAKPTFTCAPYLLNTAPQRGEQIAWAESNAIMFANSVIGACTQKYPDFLDTAIALTGRAPQAGAHTDEGRVPTMRVIVDAVEHPDDAFWPLLGYHAGELAAEAIPIISGLENTNPTLDDLKAFSAAFATTSSTAMFHLAGITPEADAMNALCHSRTKPLPQRVVSIEQLAKSWRKLNTADAGANTNVAAEIDAKALPINKNTDAEKNQHRIDLICLGNPHLSITECEKLSELCDGRKKSQNVKMVATLGRDIYNEACRQGYVAALEQFGVTFITDTCWCMIQRPVIPLDATTLMTNSGKYAHYGPGISGCLMSFGSLSQCVDAACKGSHQSDLPAWLKPHN